MIESNQDTPEKTDSSTGGWYPINHNGVTSVPMSSSSLVMTSLDAAKDRITLTGTLTTNLNLVVPAWTGKKWLVDNQCSGDNSVVVKTSTGTGVVIISGEKAQLSCDGVDVFYHSLLVENAFSEIAQGGEPAQSLALQNLGAKGASKRDVGTGSEQIPDMSSFTSSSGATGYQRFPGGLILQWGYTNPSPNNTNNTVAFPIAYPTRCNGVTLQYVNSGIVNNPSQGTPHQIGVYTRLGFDFYYSGSATDMQHFWFSWGY